MKCDEKGIELSKLPLEDDYWRFADPMSEEVVACDILEACVNSSCAKGYKGPVCAVCEDGYDVDSIGKCSECSSFGTSFGFYLLVGISSMLVVYLLLRRYVGSNIRSVFGNIDAEIKKATHDKKHWINKLRTKLKICISFYQIVAKIPSTLDAKFPQIYKSFSRNVAAVFNVDALRLISFNCLVKNKLTNFHHQLLYMTLAPMLMSAILGLITFIQTKRKTSENESERSNLVASRFGTFLALTYVVYASTSSAIF